MADTYAIFGFSNEKPVLLYDTDSCREASEWVDGYIRFGEWGGYDSIALFEVGYGQAVDSIYLHDAPIDIWESSPCE